MKTIITLLAYIIIFANFLELGCYLSMDSYLLEPIIIFLISFFLAAIILTIIIRQQQKEFNEQNKDWLHRNGKY